MKQTTKPKQDQKIHQVRRGLLKLEVRVWQQHRHCYVFDPSQMLVVKGHRHMETAPIELIFRSVPCPLKFSCRDVWRGALTKSVIRPMAAWRPRCVLRDCRSFAQIRQVQVSCTHLQTRRPYHIIRNLSTLLERSRRESHFEIGKRTPVYHLITPLRHSTPSSPRGSNGLPPDPFLPYNLQSG